MMPARRAEADHKIFLPPSNYPEKMLKGPEMLELNMLFPMFFTVWRVFSMFFPMFFQCFIHFQGTTGGSNGPQRLFIEESPSKKLSFWRKRTTRSEAAWLLDRVLDVYLHVLAQAVQY